MIIGKEEEEESRLCAATNGCSFKGQLLCHQGHEVIMN
jgi:hypothetical protein